MPVAESNSTSKKVDRRAQMARALARGGMEDVHVLSLESADEVLTPKRKEIIRTLREEDFASVRELARYLDRDKGQVSRDLQALAKQALIEYEKKGRGKSPRLRQEHIVVEPIV